VAGGLKRTRRDAEVAAETVSWCVTPPAFPAARFQSDNPRRLMGLLGGLMGNASEIDAGKVNAEFARLLTAGEQVEKAYQLIRDSFIFTNKRLILIDVQGLTGAKIDYHSIPYRSILHFSIETAGQFDLDAELKIFLAGGGQLAKRFNKKLNIYEVQAVLANYVLR
jgi:hypothetical protein